MIDLEKIKMSSVFLYCVLHSKLDSSSTNEENLSFLVYHLFYFFLLFLSIFIFPHKFSCRPYGLELSKINDIIN